MHQKNPNKFTRAEKRLFNGYSRVQDAAVEAIIVLVPPKWEGRRVLVLLPRRRWFPPQNLVFGEVQRHFGAVNLDLTVTSQAWSDPLHANNVAITSRRVKICRSPLVFELASWLPTDQTDRNVTGFDTIIALDEKSTTDCVFSPFYFVLICCWFNFSVISLYPAPHQHICSNLPGIL